MKPKALRIIEEVKKIVPTAISELKSGKIYGVLKKQLRRLAELTQKELKDIKKHLTDKKLITECEAICREAQTAFRIIRENEREGLEQEQLDIIKNLLRQIMSLETVVERQTQQDIGRREFVRQSAFASIGALLLGKKLFGANMPNYIILSTDSNVNEQFLEQVLIPEQELINGALLINYRGYLQKYPIATLLNAASESPSDTSKFLVNFYTGILFEDNKDGQKGQVSGSLLPNKDYRLVIISDADRGMLDGEIPKINNVMKDRNIEMYVYRYLTPQPPRDAATVKRIAERNWNFATKVYTTPNLDRNEFRKVISEWK